MNGMPKQLIRRLTEPFWVKCLRRHFGDRPFRLLDAGAGNHSATTISLLLPRCEYYGIDITRDYSNTEEDFALMKNFWELDLAQLSFDAVPDNFFDAITMVHVLEHLYNGGDLVLGALLGKLRQGGLVYLEYPRFQSTRLPSMRETLNFFDDETHCRIYTLTQSFTMFCSAKTAARCGVACAGTGLPSCSCRSCCLGPG
jgi:2-polyprenyl-3-methyl-5-hydroxy-6-metoxy-1,4-benzoquinol methylase